MCHHPSSVDYIVSLAFSCLTFNPSSFGWVLFNTVVFFLFFFLLIFADATQYEFCRCVVEIKNEKVSHFQFYCWYTSPPTHWGAKEWDRLPHVRRNYEESSRKSCQKITSVNRRRGAPSLHKITNDRVLFQGNSSSVMRNSSKWCDGENTLVKKKKKKKRNSNFNNGLYFWWIYKANI